MNEIRRCILVESKKMFNSKVPLISMLALTLLPLAGGFFMFIFKNPSLAENLGFISTKADIMGMGTADWSSDLARQGILLYLLCSILTILLSTPVAIFASVGRGYLSPLGFMIFTIVLAQVFAIIGYGEYFPWAIPALISGADGSGTVMIKASSIIIVALTNIVGLIGTMFWWRYADQS